MPKIQIQVTVKPRNARIWASLKKEVKSPWVMRAKIINGEAPTTINTHAMLSMVALSKVWNEASEVESPAVETVVIALQRASKEGIPANQ